MSSRLSAGTPRAIFRLAVRAQTVVATLSNQLIRIYFPSRFNLCGSTKLEPKHGRVLFDSTLVTEITLVDLF
jgi:hypothetical protein